MRFFGWRCRFIRLQLKPDDVLVVKVPDPITADCAAAICDRVREVVGNRVLVLSSDSDLAVIEKDEPRVAFAYRGQEYLLRTLP